MVICDNIDELIHRRDGIAELLEKKDLVCTHAEHFCRWHFQVIDKDGKLVWQMKDFDLKKIQKELYEFLMNYDNKRTLPTIQPSEGMATAGMCDEKQGERHHPETTRRD